MKKGDLILLLGVVAIALVWILIWNMNRNSGAYAVVTVDGKEIGVYSLMEDITTDIIGYNGGYNRLEIKDGKADVIEASCPDKLCVQQAKISRDGETIVCLPNRIVIKIIGGEKTTLDAVAK